MTTFKQGDRVSYNAKGIGSAMPHGTLGTVEKVETLYSVRVRWDKRDGLMLHDTGYLTLLPQDAPVKTADVLYKWARELEEIYVNRTAGDYTFHGVLAQFLAEAQSG